ncbi:alpha/beta hydrolase family protein [Amycolatopsis panacis]|uniref:alpha/beta hydrolase family protein n=1 Tax=Amycolatopsis panacis TaxID=2340917 RepID=UPI002D7A0F3F|nr:prolyl oligopeptidase family serine peptidase [Amycolatopsis panacis]
MDGRFPAHPRAHQTPSRVTLRTRRGNPIPVGPPHALSPVSFASRMRTPMLLMHGAEDTNVPLGQAEYLHRALQHFDVPHEYVVYPREGHSIRERGHQFDVLHRTRAWFGRWLC